MPQTPSLLDFYPLEDEKSTRISKFFDNVRQGHFTTTRCTKDQSVHWPPRVVCPQCHGEAIEWIELPKKGRLFAFSALLLGLPMGMEGEAGAVVGMVELDGWPIKIFSRIANAKYEDCHIGDAVEWDPYTIPDGRVFFRFRKPAAPPPA